MGGTLGLTTMRYNKVFLEKVPIPIPTEKQETIFNAMVDYISFCLQFPSPLKGEFSDTLKDDLKYKAQFFEDLINQMVFDLYFEDSMKKHNNYILDEIANLVQPFNDGLTDEFKLEYVQTLYAVMQENKIIKKALIYSRTVPEIEVIYKELKND